MTTSISIETDLYFSPKVVMKHSFHMDEQGKWRMTSPWAKDEPILQEDVIDLLKKSKDWKNIRRRYFPMVGFSS